MASEQKPVKSPPPLLDSIEKDADIQMEGGYQSRQIESKDPLQPPDSMPEQSLQSTALLEVVTQAELAPSLSSPTTSSSLKDRQPRQTSVQVTVASKHTPKHAIKPVSTNAFRNSHFDEAEDHSERNYFYASARQEELKLRGLYGHDNNYVDGHNEGNDSNTRGAKVQHRAFQGQDRGSDSSNPFQGARNNQTRPSSKGRHDTHDFDNLYMPTPQPRVVDTEKFVVGQRNVLSNDDRSNNGGEKKFHSEYRLSSGSRDMDVEGGLFMPETLSGPNNYYYRHDHDLLNNGAYPASPYSVRPPQEDYRIMRGAYTHGQGGAQRAIRRPVVRGHDTRYPREQYYGEEAMSEDDHGRSNDGVFVRDREKSLAFKEMKPMTAPTRYFTHEDLGPLQNGRPAQLQEAVVFTQKGVKRSRAEMTDKIEEDDNTSPPNYRSSRYSGEIMPWRVHEEPKFVAPKQMSDVALMKHRLPRGATSTTAKRATGASDPENIKVVNLYDVENWSWDKIAEHLNAERTRTGGKPGLTPNSVILRYNRTAPLLYRGRGEEFIPLRERKKGALPGKNYEIKDHLLVTWDDERLSALAQYTQEYDEQKWLAIAHRLAERFPNEQFTAKNVSMRYSLL